MGAVVDREGASAAVSYFVHQPVEAVVEVFCE